VRTAQQTPFGLHMPQAHTHTGSTHTHCTVLHQA